MSDCHLLLCIYCLVGSPDSRDEPSSREALLCVSIEEAGDWIPKGLVHSRLMLGCLMTSSWPWEVTTALTGMPQKVL